MSSPLIIRLRSFIIASMKLVLRVNCGSPCKSSSWSNYCYSSRSWDLYIAWCRYSDSYCWSSCGAMGFSWSRKQVIVSYESNENDWWKKFMKMIKRRNLGKTLCWHSSCGNLSWANDIFFSDWEVHIVSNCFMSLYISSKRKFDELAF